MRFIVFGNYEMKAKKMKRVNEKGVNGTKYNPLNGAVKFSVVFWELMGKKKKKIRKG